MLSIELHFLTGRCHATPWDRHVNEGAVEWPPSPWRLLRALLATWYLKTNTDLDEETVVSLLESLAQEAPTYCLPHATGAHTRHYMPVGQLKTGLERTTKVFDTFVHTAEDMPVIVTWPRLTLPAEDERALRLWLDRMAYLGRAESWIEARLGANSEQEGAAAPANMAPLDHDSDLGPERELIRVLCPMSSLEIGAWRTRVFEKELGLRLAEKRRIAEKKGRDPDKEKLVKADIDKIDSVLPRDLMSALQVDTGQLHKQGWSGVPGARWVDYTRPRDLVTNLPRQTRRVTLGALPTAARFAVASQVPPRLTEAISMAERVRTALMSRSDGSPVFSGKDKGGKPLSGNRHVHIFSEANGAHGRVTHVTLHARMGFDETARRALDGLRDVWGRGDHDIQLVLVGVGQREDFAGTNVAAGQCPLFVESEIWVSRTPFIPTRHAKTTRRGQPKLDPHGLQIGSPEHDLRRLLLEGGFPEPKQVEAIDSTDLDGKQVRWLEFKTIRHRGGGSRGANRGFGFRVVFPRPVRGPIAVGYAAHFGMGLFLPEIAPTTRRSPAPPREDGPA